MRSLLVGSACLALVALPAVAQQPPGPFPSNAVAQQVEPGRYWVFFDWNKSTLRPDARKAIEEAAASFKRTGAARIDIVGSADRTGSTGYNLRLSQRRADVVRRELERLGVPSSIISTRGEGYNAPITSNQPGVREPLNRYVAIVFPEREAAPPPPAPVAAAPAPQPVPPPRPKWYFTIGPAAGYNLKETDNSNHQKSSVLLGPELRLGYSFSPGYSVSLQGFGFNTLGTSQKDGWGGRAALGFTRSWDLGIWHPFVGPRVGYIAGRGVEDGLILGPEGGLAVDVAPNTFVYARIAYDTLPTRNEINQGIINGGLGLGIQF